MNMASYYIVLAVAASSLLVAYSTMEADEAACSDQLAELAGCIPYVSGTAKKPTADCCQKADKISGNHPKCLCILIKASTDPSLGLPINTSLALYMPSACNIDAKVSDCPSILNLPPGSPDAKIFNLAGNADSSTTGTTPSSKMHRSDDDDMASGTSPSGPSSESKKPASSSSTTNTNNGARMKLLSSLQGSVIMMIGLGVWMVV